MSWRESESRRAFSDHARAKRLKPHSVIGMIEATSTPPNSSRFPRRRSGHGRVLSAEAPERNLRCESLELFGSAHIAARSA